MALLLGTVVDTSLQCLSFQRTQQNGVGTDGDKNRKFSFSIQHNMTPTATSGFMNGAILLWTKD